MNVNVDVINVLKIILLDLMRHVPLILEETSLTQVL